VARFYSSFVSHPFTTKKDKTMSKYHEDYETEESEGAGFVTGLLIGAALGAIGAILYAPKSGEQTRQELKDLADQKKEGLKNQWDRTKEKAVGLVDTVRDKVDAVADRASNSVDVYADKAVEKVIQVADDAKTTVDRFKRNDEQLG
jgi:gas vesicle protein